MTTVDSKNRRGGEQPRPTRQHPSKMRATVSTNEIDFSRLRVLKTEPKCKICKHPERAEIDRMVYRQRLGHADATGKIITIQYVLDFMSSLGMGNAHVGNIRAHYGPGKHTDFLSAEQIEHTGKLVEGLMASLTPEQIELMPRQEMLDLMMRQGVAEAAGRLRATGKSGITVEHVLKMAELQIREKGSEAQNEFLKALGGGIVSAVKHGLPKPGTKLIGEAEVVDVLAAEEEVDQLVA